MLSANSREVGKNKQTNKQKQEQKQEQKQNKTRNMLLILHAPSGDP